MGENLDCKTTIVSLIYDEFETLFILFSDFHGDKIFN